MDIRAIALKKIYTMSIKERDELSSIICKKVIKSKEFKDCDKLLAYISLPSEVNTLPIIKEALLQGKKVGLPTCVNDNIIFKEYSENDNLVLGSYNILESSSSNTISSDSTTLILVPGRAFDKKNNRIGRGKGFYDRYLSTYKGKSLGLCYSVQVFEKLEVNSLDQKVDSICNEL